MTTDDQFAAIEQRSKSLSAMAAAGAFVGITSIPAALAVIYVAAYRFIF